MRFRVLWGPDWVPLFTETVNFFYWAVRTDFMCIFSPWLCCRDQVRLPVSADTRVTALLRTGHLKRRAPVSTTALAQRQLSLVVLACVMLLQILKVSDCD